MQLWKRFGCEPSGHVHFVQQVPLVVNLQLNKMRSYESVSWRQFSTAGWDRFIRFQLISCKRNCLILFRTSPRLCFRFEHALTPPFRGSNRPIFKVKLFGKFRVATAWANSLAGSDSGQYSAWTVHAHSVDSGQYSVWTVHAHSIDSGQYSVWTVHAHSIDSGQYSVWTVHAHSIDKRNRVGNN